MSNETKLTDLEERILISMVYGHDHAAEYGVSERMSRLDDIELSTLGELCAKEGIEIVDDFANSKREVIHCGVPMHNESDVMGPSFAKCLICGKAIANVICPTVNGGYMMAQEFHTRQGERTWLLV